MGGGGLWVILCFCFALLFEFGCFSAVDGGEDAEGGECEDEEEDGEWGGDDGEGDGEGEVGGGECGGEGGVFLEGGEDEFEVVPEDVGGE